MDINIPVTLLAALIASVAVFVAGGILYMNPLVARFYRKAEADKEPGVRIWDKTAGFLAANFITIAIQNTFWAFVFALLKPALFGAFVPEFLIFGAIIATVKIIPRLFDMWVQTTYPNKLLTIEFINGIILGLVSAAVFAWVI
jgi:hypothetical protein